MFTAVIEKAADRWIKAGIVQKNDKDIYVYGLDLLLFTIINNLVIIITAALFNKLPETLILLSVVIPLQAFGGGYHAETHLRCFLIMFVGGCAVMPLTAFITPIIATIISCFSLVAIYIFAPVPHVNVPMSEKRRRKMRIISYVLGSTAALLSIMLLWSSSKYVYFGIYSATGLGVIAFSMLCAWIKHRFTKTIE